jgi:hypothetical protein
MRPSPGSPTAGMGGVALAFTEAAKDDTATHSYAATREAWHGSLLQRAGGRSDFK